MMRTKLAVPPMAERAAECPRPAVFARLTAFMPGALSVLALGLALALPSGSARAQPVRGVYVDTGVGYAIPENTVTTPYTTPTTSSTQFERRNGIMGLGAIGYGFGNGFRLELEGNIRQNGFAGLSSTVPHEASGNVQTYGAMANVMFDMDIGSPYIYPYIGAGAGYSWTHLDGVRNYALDGSDNLALSGTEGGFTWQAIAGASFPVPNTPGLSLTAEYRFIDVEGGETFSGTDTTGAGTMPAALKLHNQMANVLLLGVRYTFGVTPPPMPAPAPVAAPAPAPARSYLVFFDWDKATLSDRAREIIHEAADNSMKVKYTAIEVNGYTDTSGTAKYNQGLSVRRAQAVAAELVRDGVPKSAIAIQGFGETHLLVPTGPGVREPQNRRVEIIIK